MLPLMMVAGLPGKGFLEDCRIPDRMAWTRLRLGRKGLGQGLYRRQNWAKVSLARRVQTSPKYELGKNPGASMWSNTTPFWHMLQCKFCRWPLQPVVISVNPRAATVDVTLARLPGCYKGRHAALVLSAQTRIHAHCPRADKQPPEISSAK